MRIEWRRHIQWTWEDTVFSAMTIALALVDPNARLFNFYSTGVILLALSHAYRRGLLVGLVRMAALSTVLILARQVKGFPWQPPLLEVGGLIGGGLIAGAFGELQRKSKEALKQSLHQIVEVLARSLECRDPYTEGHSRRTAQYAVCIARKMGLEEKSLNLIEQAGLLHDLGKLGMPDAILRKDAKLTPEEIEHVRKHPEEGARILRDIPSLAETADLVKHHHEHFDGSGYPDGLRGGRIPLAARILSVADAFDALTTDRPYRKATTPLLAIEEIKTNASRYFDPKVIEALVALERN